MDSIFRFSPFTQVMMWGVPLISTALHLVLRMSRQEHLEQLLEGLLQSLQDVGDSNVSQSRA